MRKYVTVGALAEHLQCPMMGDREKRLYGIALMEESSDDMLTYVPSDRIDRIEMLRAGAILTRASIGLPLHRNYIYTRRDPYEMLVQAIQFLIDNGLYGSPCQTTPQIADDCMIGDYVSVGNGSEVGAGTLLSHGVVIGERVKIGKFCQIGANTVIGSDSSIGDHTIIGSCCCIGTENFEYLQTPKSWIKIPVVGRAVIGEHVRIGGNVVIEKGTIGTTAIGSDTQIENLVQIGHEVRIGSGCHIVACTAIAGWAEIGDHVTIYGQSAVNNRIHVGNHAVLLARSGVDKPIADDQIVSGSPAQNHHEEMRFQAFLRKLYRMRRKGGR